MAARKFETFGNGTPYVPAGPWAMFFAWLIDFVVFVLGFAVAFVVAAGVLAGRDLSGGVILAVTGGLLFAVPLVYGLFYTGGRALGAVLTGTRLVRTRDGGRIGAKGPWAMLVRTILLPLLLVAVMVGGGYAPGSLKRISIDAARTHRLRTEGLPA
ncbi:RDD family protein [Phytomonospora sp. NPDC050363]|uniref:RDD family protein n=1 Tax=Phytomonospora sp. NPDC050363 TaxID=3155642 RepID=UPI0033FA6BB9